jgi:hypothetical protein
MYVSATALKAKVFFGNPILVIGCYRIQTSQIICAYWRMFQVL